MSEEGPKPLYWLPLLLTAFCAFGIWIGSSLFSKNQSENKNLQKLEQIFQVLDQQYVDQINTEEIEQYRNHLHSIGLSNATIKHKLHPVGATIKYAKKLGYQTSEVEIPRLKVSKGRLRYLTELEEKKLLVEIDP